MRNVIFFNGVPQSPNKTYMDSSRNRAVEDV